MPERQSSPGEVTARPTADADESGAPGSAATDGPDRTGTSTNGTATDPTPQGPAANTSGRAPGDEPGGSAAGPAVAGAGQPAGVRPRPRPTSGSQRATAQAAPGAEAAAAPAAGAAARPSGTGGDADRAGAANHPDQAPGNGADSRSAGNRAADPAADPAAGNRAAGSATGNGADGSTTGDRAAGSGGANSADAPAADAAAAAPTRENGTARTPAGSGGNGTSGQGATQATAEGPEPSGPRPAAAAGAAEGAGRAAPAPAPQRGSTDQDAGTSGPRPGAPRPGGAAPAAAATGGSDPRATGGSDPRATGGSDPRATSGPNPRAAGRPNPAATDAAARPADGRPAAKPRPGATAATSAMSAATPGSATPNPAAPAAQGQPGDDAPTTEVRRPQPGSTWFVDTDQTQALPVPPPAAPAEQSGTPTTRVPRATDTVAASVAASEAANAEAPTMDVPTDGSRTSGPNPAARASAATVTVDASRRAEAPSAGQSSVDLPTVRLPLAAGTAGADDRTAYLSAPPAPAGPSGPPTPTPDADADAPAGAPRRRRLLIAVAAVVGVLGLLYVVDLVTSSGAVPRGVRVAGVSVGGLDPAAAEERLRTEIEPRTSRPIAVTVGEATAELDPTAAGLAVDWTATLDQAGSQPLNPITRLTSFFSEREVGVVTTTDPAALDTAIGALAPIVDRPPAEGSVRFNGVTPEPVDPQPGQQLDQAAAAEVLTRDWATGGTVVLPVVELPPTTAPEDVVTALDIAGKAVTGPVTVIGEDGVEGTVKPAVVAEALSFRAEAGDLLPELNPTVIKDALEDQLAASEQPGRDAALDFSSGTPVVVPSQDGRGVDYEATLKDFLAVLTGTGPREITAVYADQPAELTTDELNQLGITGVIGEFTTGGFAADSGQNIKRAAEVINGTIVQPGETFSLNALTNPRNAANGYVEAGIISDGHPSRGVGGGVSQVATTTYNAAYFAGMTDVEHKEHSFYISRYPAGREATVFDDVIDLKFRNDNPTGVMVQTVWTPSSLTVRIYGTKRYEVTSTPGPRTNPTQPNVVTIPAGQPCAPSQGAPGFTVTDTRTLQEVSTGQVRNETRTVTYKPSPIVVCGS